MMSQQPGIGLTLSTLVKEMENGGIQRQPETMIRGQIPRKKAQTRALSSRIREFGF
jgi:hypothetical protein